MDDFMNELVEPGQIEDQAPLKDDEMRDNDAFSNPEQIIGFVPA